MSLIKNKWVSAAFPLDDTKIKLRNNQYLKARNFADSADISVVKINASDVPEFALFPEKSGTPTTANQLVNKAYVDGSIGSVGEWQDSVIDKDLTAPPGSPASGDRYLIGLDTAAAVATGAWATKDGQITEYNGASWVFYPASNGWFVSADDENTLLYYFSGTTWTARYFEATTASLGLVKVGMDIRIDSSAAGDGLSLTAGALAVKLEASNPSLQIASDELGVKIDTARAMSKGASGLGVDVSASGAVVMSGGDLAVQVEASNPSLAIVANELGVKLDPAGAIVKDTAGIKSKLEASNPSLQISSNELGVKFGASSGLQKDATGLLLKVNAATLKINGSGEIEGIKPKKEDFTLNGTNITNQYVDMAEVIKAESLMLFVDGVMQDEVSDYTVSLTGGAGGKTRISFAGDLAVQLLSGDILHIMYQYL